MWTYLLAALLGAGIGLATGDLIFPTAHAHLGIELFNYAKALGGGAIGLWAWALAQRQRV
ncbi:MAG TPA: hypothetical protein VGB88_00980 [Alphaproteobacteria bacterium]